MYDNMDGDENEDEPQDDDEKALQEALALSMMPNVPGEEKKDDQPKKEEPKPKEPENVDIDADMLKGVIDDLGIDIEENELDDIVNEAKKGEDEKDDDKKDDKKKD